MSQASTTATSIVKFNVGGTKYEVSRSLLDRYPNTMLARMVSETWNPSSENDQAPLFIERDGLRFRFVLDYMRDGKVHLPAGCGTCKESLLTELNYFGFEDNSTAPIQITRGGVWEATNMVRDLEFEHKGSKIAYLCYCEYRDKFGNSTQIRINKDHECYQDAKRIHGDRASKKVLSDSLAKFELVFGGVQLVNQRNSSGCVIEFKKMTT